MKIHAIFRNCSILVWITINKLLAILPAYCTTYGALFDQSSILDPQSACKANALVGHDKEQEIAVELNYTPISSLHSPFPYNLSYWSDPIIIIDLGWKVWITNAMWRWVFLLLVSDPAEGVEIIDLVMPETAESGNDSEIILDCDYDFSDEERNQLEVKWYFNGDHKPFFQWIPGKDRKPQLSGERFANHIDLEFVAHEDEAKQYRALKIVNPSPELSGSYRCKVSTLIDEDFKQRDLIVYGNVTKSIKMHILQMRVSFGNY